MADDDERNLLLKNFISEIKDNYEYIFIDTPPTLGLLTVSSLTASDEVLIPVQCEFFALEGLSKLIKTIELVKSNLNINLKLNGIILTMYDRRNSLSSLIEREAREYFDANVYKFNVPRNVTLSEAPSHGLPAIIYDLKTPIELEGFTIMTGKTASNTVPKPTEWIIENVLPKGFNSCLAGTTGSKKSMWAIQLGLSVANGEKDFCGNRIKGGSRKVLFIDTEIGQDELLRRYHKIKSKMDFLSYIC